MYSLAGITRKIVTLFVMVLMLASCVEATIIGSAAVGFLVMREKTVESSRSDLNLRTRIYKEFTTEDIAADLKNIKVKVIEGRAFLMGKIPSEQTAVAALRAAWRVKEVKEVIDELEVKPRPSPSFANNNNNNSNNKNALDDRKGKGIAGTLKSAHADISDSIIKKRIRAKILLNSEIKSINYSIRVIDKTVYLMGIGQSQSEINRVAEIASKIRGVRKVISHVILVDDHRRQ